MLKKLAKFLFSVVLAFIIVLGGFWMFFGDLVKEEYAAYRKSSAVWAEYDKGNMTDEEIINDLKLMKELNMNEQEIKQAAIEFKNDPCRQLRTTKLG